MSKTSTLHACTWCDHLAGSTEALEQHIDQEHVGPATREHLRKLNRTRTRK
jgi:hypothetical protein